MIARARQLVLASASPRRRQLLREAGFEPILDPPDVDDADLHPGHASAREWVAAMAWFKARRVASRRVPAEELILAADTVCALDGAIVGKPIDAADARKMLQSMRGRDHDVFTAVCLLPADGEEPDLIIDHSVVTLGPLPDADIDRYVAGDGWKGKAGGYNLSERIEAGWPIRWSGDPTSVMGLPMQRLTPMLRQRLDRNARAEVHR